MNFKQNQKFNVRNAKAGMTVRLHHSCKVICDTTEETAVLLRRQADTLWFALIGGEEKCIGSGYDWTIQA